MPCVYIFRTCALPPSQATLNSGRLSAKSTASAALIVDERGAAAHPRETAERMLRAPHLANSGPFRSRAREISISPRLKLVPLLLPRQRLGNVYSP